ncbi:hypothetical protein Tco_0935744 [Tanacetum coccineum]
MYRYLVPKLINFYRNDKEDKNISRLSLLAGSLLETCETSTVELIIVVDLCWAVNTSWIAADAIELYCEKKLKSHPDNLVGIFAMGATGFGSVVEPTQSRLS